MGSHVSRTARIEPVTPPEAVYVTEPFAAALALEGRAEFSCGVQLRLRRAHARRQGVRALRMYRLWGSGPGPAENGA